LQSIPHNRKNNIHIPILLSRPVVLLLASEHKPQLHNESRATEPAAGGRPSGDPHGLLSFVWRLAAALHSRDGPITRGRAVRVWIVCEALLSLQCGDWVAPLSVMTQRAAAQILCRFRFRASDPDATLAWTIAGTPSLASM
jgi:hypothetical protein